MAELLTVAKGSRRRRFRAVTQVQTYRAVDVDDARPITHKMHVKNVDQGAGRSEERASE